MISKAPDESLCAKDNSFTKAKKLKKNLSANEALAEKESLCAKDEVFQKAKQIANQLKSEE